MSIEKWWKEICAGENGRNLQKNLTKLRLVHHDTHVKWPRREVVTPAVGEESLTACAGSHIIIISIIN